MLTDGRTHIPHNPSLEHSHGHAQTCLGKPRTIYTLLLPIHDGINQEIFILNQVTRWTCSSFSCTVVISSVNCPCQGKAKPLSTSQFDFPVTDLQIKWGYLLLQNKTGVVGWNLEGGGEESLSGKPLSKVSEIKDALPSLGLRFKQTSKEILFIKTIYARFRTAIKNEDSRRERLHVSPGNEREGMRERAIIPTLLIADSVWLIQSETQTSEMSHSWHSTLHALSLTRTKRFYVVAQRGGCSDELYFSFCFFRLDRRYSSGRPRFHELTFFHL